MATENPKHILAEGSREEEPSCIPPIPATIQGQVVGGGQISSIQEEENNIALMIDLNQELAQVPLEIMNVSRSILEIEDCPSKGER